MNTELKRALIYALYACAAVETVKVVVTVVEFIRVRKELAKAQEQAEEQEREMLRNADETFEILKRRLEEQKKHDPFKEEVEDLLNKSKTLLS